MSDEFYDEFGEPIRDENIRSQMKALKAQAKKAEQLEAQLAERDLQIAFAEAGVPRDGLGALLRDSWKGEPNPEAIKAKAIEYGILGAPKVQEPDTSEAELDALRRAAGVTASGGVSIVDPQAEFLTALAAANSPEEAERVITQFGSKTGLHVNRGM